MTTPDPHTIAEALGLQPLPDEGGLFRQTHIDEHSTAILYMLIAPDFSALHTLDSVEVYHWHAGAPVRITLIDDAGTVTENILGPDILAGQRPQLVVAPGVWQGSTSTGEWSLLGTTMAPGFTWEGFSLGNRSDLLARFPHAREHITALTREEQEY